MNMKKWLNIYRKDDVLLGEWILVAFISFMAFIMFRYRSDFHTLTIWSLNLLDVIADGDLRNFYAYSALNLHGVQFTYVGGEFFALIPWSLWNIPLWIAQRFFEVDVLNTVWSIFWSKLFLVGCLGVTSFYAYKIGIVISNDKPRSKWIAMLTMSSITAFVGVYYTSQSDIIAIAFSAIAVYYLLQKKHLMFILFAACSIAAKPFFLFPFVALVFLHEKRILYAALNILGGFSVIAICRLIFHGAPMYAESLAMGPLDFVANMLTASGITMGFGHASFFFISLVVLYYICFTAKPSKEQSLMFTIFAVAAVYLLWIVLSREAYYRVIMFIPFLPILFMCNKRTVKVSMLIYTLVTFLMIFMAVGNFMEHGDDMFVIRHMILTPIDAMFPVDWAAPRYNHNLLFMTHNLIPNWSYPIINAVILVGSLLLLYINYPGSQKQVPFENEKCYRWLLWCNMFMVVPFLIGALYAYFNVIPA